MIVEQLKIEIEQLIASGLHKELHLRGLRKAGLIEIKGKRLVDFTNWDILGINENKKFKRAAQKSIEENGIGTASSRLSSGTTISHTSCETRLAKFFGAQSSLLFSSKNQAVFSLLTALANESDLICFDEQIQSPALDVAYLVNAQSLAFNSANLSALNNELNKFKKVRRKFILLETVSPISGRKINLEELLQIASRHQAFLMLDESFAIASEGLRGAGLLDEKPIGFSEFCLYGSLSNTVPCYGAFVAGSGTITNYIIQRSKTFAHEVPLPPVIAGSIESAIDIIELAQQERSRLAENIKMLRENLSKHGFLDASHADSAVVSIMIGTTKQAIRIANLLISKDFFVDVVSLSTSLTDIGLIRLLVNSSHTAKQLESISLSIAEISSKISED